MDFYKDYYLLPAETASQYYSPIKIRAMSILASKVYWELIDKINKSNSFPYKAYSEKCAAIILGPWLINNVIHRLIDTLQRVSIRETIGTPYKLKTIRLTGHVPSCNFGSGELLGNNPVIQEWMASLVQRNLFVSKEESPVLELDFVVKSDFVQENENRHYFLKRGRNFLLNCVARSFHPRTILSSYFYGYTPSLSYKIGASPDNLFELHPPSVVLSQRKNLSGEILSLSDQASEIIVSYFGNIFPMSNAVEAVSKCLSEIISIFLPVQLFECFDSTISQAESFLRKKNYKALLTSIGFYDRPSYSYLCAVAKKNGVPIFGGQHGGGYGAFQSFSGLTEVEGGIPDYFLTWGWESWDMAYLPSYKNNTRKMPSLKLWLDKKRIRRSARGEYVIFVPTFRQDFIRRFGSGVIPDQVETYVREGVEIIKKLVCDFPVKYKVSHEKGYDNLERRLNIIKPVKVDSGCTKSLRSYFSKAIVVVYDHLSTGTLESITCNIPTLLWLDKKYIAFREEFQIYLDRMEKVGIVKYDVNSFNENFERIKNDIDGWWYSNEVQHVLDDFRENHCHLGERPYKEFCEGLERFISSHPD